MQIQSRLKEKVAVEWLNDLIGLFILILFLLTPVLRRILGGSSPQEEEEELQQEEEQEPIISLKKEPKVPETTKIRYTRMPPMSPSPPKALPHDPFAFSKGLSERQKLVVYQEIFSFPKGLE